MGHVVHSTTTGPAAGAGRGPVGTMRGVAVTTPDRSSTPASCGPTSRSSSRPMHGKPLAFLDSAASSQKPRQVLDAMTRVLRDVVRERAPRRLQLAERATEALEARAREDARVRERALDARDRSSSAMRPRRSTSSPTRGGSSNLGPGDVVLVTELEHHSNYVPWQFIARRTGADFRMLPLDDQRRAARSTCSTRPSATGTVKVVAVGLVSNSLGTVNPVEKLAPWAHDRGAIVVCDAAQAAPHRRLDVQTLGADFVAVLGAQDVRPERASASSGAAPSCSRQMDPVHYGGHMIRKVGVEETSWGELPHKFEAGTAADGRGGTGLGAAIDYSRGGRPGRDRGARARARRLRARPARRAALGDRVRAARRPARGHRLLQRRRRPSARRRAGARLGGRRDPRRPPLLPAADARSSAWRATNRASFYLYTIPEEIDRLVEGLRKVKEVLG